MKIKVIYLDDLNNANLLKGKLTALDHNVVIERLDEKPLLNSAVDIVVVYIEKDINLHSAIDNLIKTYSLNGARIIGVHSINKNTYKLPEALEKVADAIVCWDDAFIKKAIQGENIFVDAECQERKKKNIPRYSC